MSAKACIWPAQSTRLRVMRTNVALTRLRGQKSSRCRRWSWWMCRSSYGKASRSRCGAVGKTGTVGGKTLAASAPFMKADMIRLPQYYHTQIVKAGIPIRYFKEADESSVKEFAPDVLIWAAGGSVVRPKSIPGIDRKNVYSAEAALRNLVPLGEKIAIIGGGQVGIEAALHFDRMGHKVTVIEMADKNHAGTALCSE